MKKYWKLIALPLVAAAMLFSGNSAWAVKQFETEFKKMYYKPDGDANEKKLAAAIDKITDAETKNSCGICHGSDKKERNEYGKAVNKLLKKADKLETQKIIDALKTTEGEKNAAGKSFGELIKAGTLPGG